MASYFVGTSGWNYDCWKNDFYAARPAGPSWLSRCGPDFSAAETNATFYRLITESAGARLRQCAASTFRYTLKLPRPVTHQRLLADIETEIGVFWHAAALLQDRLGAILLQVSPDLPLDLSWLHTVLMAFSDPSRVAVEFRAPTWQGEEVRRQLETVGAAHVCVDAPHTLPSDWVTGKRAYLRLHGRRRWYADSYTLPELEEIARRVQRMAVRGAEEIYIIFNNDIEEAALANAAALKRLLN